MLKASTSDFILALAQVIFTGILLIAIIVLVFFLVIHSVEMTPAALSIVTGTITALTTILTLQMNYFYARQRPPTLPDPTPTTGDPNAKAPLTAPVLAGGASKP